MLLTLTWGLKQSSHLGCKPCSESTGLHVVLLRDAVRKWVGRKSQLSLITVMSAQLAGPEWSCFLLFAVFILYFYPTRTVAELSLAKPSIALEKPVPKLEGPSQHQTNHILQTGSLRKSWEHDLLFTPLWLREEQFSQTCGVLGLAQKVTWLPTGGCKYFFQKNGTHSNWGDRKDAEVNKLKFTQESDYQSQIKSHCKPLNGVILTSEPKGSMIQHQPPNF